MSKFKVGDRVRIVNHRNSHWNAKMDKWQGKIMTIRELLPDNNYHMEEDRGEHPYGEGWCWKASDFAELIPASKIVITTDGTVTLARLYEGKKVVKRAEARCSPDDTFDFNVGAQLAFNRLVYGADYHPAEVAFRPGDKPKQEPIKLYCVKELNDWLTVGKIYESADGWITTDDSDRHTDSVMLSHGCLVPLVSRPAKVGEWVYVEGKTCQSAIKAGQIYQIKAHYHTNTYGVEVAGMKSLGDGLWCICDKDYLVLDGYQPEPEQPKCYNGKVVCVENHYGSSITLPDLTPGKVYGIVNGVLTDDTGYEYEPYKTLDDICAASGNKFIEFKGE